MLCWIKLYGVLTFYLYENFRYLFCQKNKWWYISFIKLLLSYRRKKDTYLAQRTQFMCWLNENKNFCLWTAQTLTVLSSEAVTMDWPSLEKWTLLTVAVWALNAVDSPLLKLREKNFVNTKMQREQQNRRPRSCILNSLCLIQTCLLFPENCIYWK